MKRRDIVLAAAGSAVSALAGAAASDWIQNAGYPSGWGPRRDWEDATYRIGNHSGGYEKMFRVGIIKAPATASPLKRPARTDAARLAPIRAAVDEHLKTWPITGLLIARQGSILVERYQFDQKPEMRLTSWSLAKSVTSLLLGICRDRGLVRSMDDTADVYVPELKNTLHGGVTLRNLCNMSSGAEVIYDRDVPIIYDKAFLRADSDVDATVRDWNVRQEPQGSRFEYNELCALTVGMVIRKVTGRTLSEFCQEALWQPMGAEADASWLRDSKSREYNCIGFGARLRDWARLGQLVAQGGAMQGRQVVSASWIDECSSWSARDNQVRHGRAMRDRGYKYFFWHPRPDGKWMMMLGKHGQLVLVDRDSQTVLVQTAVEADGEWQAKALQLFDTALRVEG